MLSYVNLFYVNMKSEHRPECNRKLVCRASFDKVIMRHIAVYSINFVTNETSIEVAQRKDLH